MPPRSRDYHGRCAFCSAPLISNAAGLVAWRVGNQFVCNEFCADGVPDERVSHEAVGLAGAAHQPPSSH